MSDTISLYLDLEPGLSADLEVVARAALAWASAVRDMAAQLDPMCEARLELVSGTKSSLSLNAVVKLLRSAAPSRKTTRTLLLAVILWLAKHPAEWAYDQILDAVKAHFVEHEQPLSDEEAHKVAKDVATLLRPSVAEAPKRQLFRELERDSAVRGVGATETPGDRPASLVPRAEFAERAGQREASDDEDDKRSIVAELDVVLVSPVLKDAERRWRFQHGALPEFGATMKDHVFLEDLNSGRIAVTMRPGLHMRIELQSKEEMVGGVREVKERNVLKVIEPSDRGQPTFLLPTEK